MNTHPRNYRSRNRRHRPSSVLLTLALSGCLWHPSAENWTAEEQQEKVAEYAAEGGYNASPSYNVKTLHETWQRGTDTLDVTFSAPEAPGRFPLIVYLPGLGETAMGGELWHKAWTSAGYAVFTLQPAELAEALRGLPPPGKRDKPGAWSFGEKQGLDDAQAVRNSELHYLGRNYFSPDALHKRLELTAWALHKLQTLSSDPASLFAAADVAHTVIAGYELGAQTAAALAGESVGQAVPDLGKWRPQAAVLLSPTVDLASGNVHARFKHLILPLLAVTGNADDDPYGVGSASLRSALWDYAASAEKYLLLLQGVPHQLFAGSNAPLHLDELPPEQPDEDFSESGHAHDPRSGGLLQGMGRSSSHRPDKTQMFKQMAAIRSVTTAFLDATIKADEPARQWLNDKAANWTGRWVALKSKRK